jgi:hypothetical protein
MLEMNGGRKLAEWQACRNEMAWGEISEASCRCGWQNHQTGVLLIPNVTPGLNQRRMWGDYRLHNKQSNIRQAQACLMTCRMTVANQGRPRERGRIVQNHITVYP